MDRTKKALEKAGFYSGYCNSVAERLLTIKVSFEQIVKENRDVLLQEMIEETDISARERKHIMDAFNRDIKSIVSSLKIPENTSF